jgi:hypothetical protein
MTIHLTHLNEYIPNVRSATLQSNLSCRIEKFCVKAAIPITRVDSMNTSSNAEVESTQTIFGLSRAPSGVTVSNFSFKSECSLGGSPTEILS